MKNKNKRNSSGAKVPVYCAILLVRSSANRINTIPNFLLKGGFTAIVHWKSTEKWQQWHRSLGKCCLRWLVYYHARFALGKGFITQPYSLEERFPFGRLPCWNHFQPHQPVKLQKSHDCFLPAALKPSRPISRSKKRSYLIIKRIDFILSNWVIFSKTATRPSRSSVLVVPRLPG